MSGAMNGRNRVFSDWLRRDEYRSRYSVHRDECGVWRIRGRLGDIEPYALSRDGTRVVSLCCFMRCKRARDAARLRKRLPGYCRVTKRGKGDTDLLIAFPEKRLDEMAEVLGAYHRRAAG